MKLSRLTLSVGLYVIASAYFMQQVWAFARKTFGVKALVLSFVIFSILIFLLIIRRSLKLGSGPARIASVAVFSILAFFFAWKQPYVTEKTHIIEYGFLGWMALRDLSKGGPVRLKGVLYAFIFVLIIGSLDEGFQKMLPWRVFEVRDMITNFISGVFGIVIYALG